MAARIHPLAVVEEGARLGEDVEIGPFAYVGPEVVLGDRCRLHHHASVEGFTTLGADCEVFPYACIGGKTQDLKYKGGRPGTRIGDRCVFREYVTVHAATDDGDFTVIGDDVLLLAYSHVAHDCQVGNHVVASNYTGLAGHVVVGDHVVFGAFTGVHQFCRIGDYAMLGGKSRVVHDVPPFMIVEGSPAVVRGFNRVGIERADFDEARRGRVKAIYRTLYRAGLTRSQAIERLASGPDADTPEVRVVLEFARRSERGFCPGSQA
ncbi:MAG: acyl-ACP--UDP-N-acetylglucosamine O-acyltransferase [Verrucomicrobia bacterium]|nr:MAG: acyl-ACP--UDP-N-acetylglucosamine O-acyltransferase [Verrucomicrobiota bacterium]